MAAFNTSPRLFDGLMYLVVILAGGLSLVNGKITAGDLVAYMLYVTTLILAFSGSPMAQALFRGSFAATVVFPVPEGP